MLLLEGLDLLCVFQGQADFVEPVQQAVLAVRRDLEAEPLTGRIAHGLGFQVDAQLVALLRGAFAEQLVDDID